MSGKIPGFIAHLCNSGIAAHDDDEIRLKKTLLVLATALVAVASMLWLPLYWDAGPERSAALTFLFQLALAGNLACYLKTTNFHAFRQRQLTLFLLWPFIAQWVLGDFITGSGLILWGLLGPVAAILCFGVAESLKWFVSYVALIVLTAVANTLLGGPLGPGDGAKANPSATLFMVLNCAVISSIVYLLLRYAMTQKQKLETMLIEAHELLQLEQTRSERLLRNILPDNIAERLKTSDKPIADGIEDAVVMFADIVNFTPVAARLSAVDVFTLLNRVFSTFDDLVEHYGLEKIKTIGDAYMVAGGLRAGSSHDGKAMADLALDMQQALRQGFVVGGQRLQVRIGITSGPLVAGVVGKKKFTLDLWGDTVNLASRISEEAQPGMILIDTATQQKLAADFQLQDNGCLMLKGKGQVRVFQLHQRRGRFAGPVTRSQPALPAKLRATS